MPRNKLPRYLPEFGNCFALTDLMSLAKTSRTRTRHWHQKLNLPYHHGPRQMKIVLPNELEDWIRNHEARWTPAITRLRIELERLDLLEDYSEANDE